MSLSPDQPPNQLSPEHLKQLRDGSGISLEIIQARGYRTITDPRELARRGFSPAQQRVPGFIIPQFAPDGSNGFCLFKPDYPRQRRHKNGKLKDGYIKYELPKGSALRLDCPPVCFKTVENPSIPLWITEGTKKADCLASRNQCAISLSGVYAYKGKNEFGGVTLLADFDAIALKDRDVRIVFDSDLINNPQVRRAQNLLTEHLKRKGARVGHVYLPGSGETKVGVDDYLLSHTIEELEALIDAPRPQPKAAPAIVELLDAPPPAMRRPLAIVGDRAYAAIWAYTKTTITESVSKEGTIVRHDPPLVQLGRRLCIVRDDGVIFGDGGHSLSELGFDAALPEIPPDDRLWSTPGVKRFVSGYRPQPANLFERVTATVDRFIDFDSSLAEQKTMCELVSCYCLATWFLAAFNVIGFLWPNGEKGSGKTQLLTLIADLGYLGQLILAGGSFAALRDLADYGATICFDDAENLSDPKKSDPDKRTLLLAGNRRGNTVPFKEPAADRTWRTRYVSTFCARCFSAIRPPDPVLGSRSIVIPLLKTVDRDKANADPASHSLWPHDRRELLDDLWMIALGSLVAMQEYDSRVAKKATLSGRELEPWRALLAVALWLEEFVPGLWRRMDHLSVSYQREREGLESADLTALTVAAVCHCLGATVVSDVKDVFLSGMARFLTTAEITEKVKALATEAEADIDIEKISTRRIGWVLKKLRLRKDRNSERTKRGWEIGAKQLTALVTRYCPNTSENTSGMPETSEETPF